MKLAGYGPWQAVEQRMIFTPVPMVATRFRWPEVEMERTVFAAAPEGEGFFVRATPSNKTEAGRECELASLLRNAEDAQSADGVRLVAGGKPLLRVCQPMQAEISTYSPSIPGPLGGGPQLRHRVKVAEHASASFDLQFLGEGLSREEAYAAAAKVWREKLASAVPVQLPDPKLQYAYDGCLRQMLKLIESARIMRGSSRGSRCITARIPMTPSKSTAPWTRPA